MRKKWMIGLIFVLCFLTGCQKVNYIKDGTDQLNAGEYENAIEQFEQAIAEGDRLDEAYKGIGFAHYEMEEYAQALDAFENALKKGADRTPMIYNLMGICEMKLGNYQGALNDFNIGLISAETVEGDYEAIVQEMKYNEVVCYENIQNWSSARTKIEEYILLYPDDQAAQKEAQFLRTR